MKVGRFENRLVPTQMADEIRQSKPLNFLFLKNHGFDVQFTQLLLGNGRRAIGHQTLALLRLRKSDDIANAIQAR